MVTDAGNVACKNRSYYGKTYLLVKLLAICIFLAGCDQQTQHRASKSSGINAINKLGSSTHGNYSRAYRIRRFQFPKDHVSHPEFKHEWWYFSGNLMTDSGRQFGYQFTLFRIGLNIDESHSPLSSISNNPKLAKGENFSRWRAKDFYMAHFSLTDVVANRFLTYERFQRSALGLAGALQTGVNTTNESKGIRLWIDDWVVKSVTDNVFPLRLSAEQDEVSVKLYLDKLKPIILNGDEGLSHKGRKAGNASYYYSIPRLETSGTIVVDGETFRVTGNSWFDREWSTTILEPGQVGWDWFALQLEDGREIMFYQLRRDDGSMDSISAGTYIRKDGSYESILARDVKIKVNKYWVSPKTGIKYPADWSLSLLKYDMELRITPTVAQQELDSTVNYWEGSVAIKGTSSGGRRDAIQGHGYVELAGYN